MRKRFTQFVKHPLVSGSSIVVIGSLAANVVNYFSSFAVARLLIPYPSDYGIYASLISIFNIFSVFALTIATVFTKFSAVLVGQNKTELIGPLIVKGSLWIGIISFIISGLTVVFASQIANFLNIDNSGFIIIISVALFFSFLTSVLAGVLQGLLKFAYLSFAHALSSSVKLILGVVLLLMGLRVFGATNAFMISVVAAYIISFFPLYKYLNKNNATDISIKNLYGKLSSYAVPVFLSTIGMTMLISIDIILIKHYFPAEIASHYAALSLMGRSIFYAVSPITLVMFPLIAQKKERKENLHGTIFLAAFFTGAPAIGVSIIYFLFPELILNIFFPSKEYVTLTRLLGPFSLFFVFYTLSFLFNSFYLSIGKGKVFLLTIGSAVLEIIFIVFFHQNLSQIVTGLAIISFLLLFSLLLYYPYATKSS
ncbi:MAG: oligosaccharide flippase family protein [Candidatus Levybacteria bacterium]|nr:oligosaccharide flippase family protein [Candidatus Levybacteria bacterium]